MKRLALLLCLTCLCAPACHRHKGAKTKVDELSEKVAAERSHQTELEVHLQGVRTDLNVLAEGDVRSSQRIYDNAVDELKTMQSPGAIEAQKIKVAEAKQALDKAIARVKEDKQEESDLLDQIKKSQERQKEIVKAGLGN